MSLCDWLILIIPTAIVMGVGIYSMKYVRSVADFLSAGRVAGRYVISVGDVAAALSIIGLAAYVEVHYKTGFALVFWNNILLPLGIVISLFGYCTYRFRETKAMSLGQFLEMRYNRPFRIFASCLRSVSEMLANMIMPAVAARFFIYFLDLPHTVNIFGVEMSTFVIIVLICLTLAITLICCGGTLSLLITDALQGMFLFPLMVIFVIFILWKFNWSTDIVPVMSDRVANESFLNPYDISDLRDFNLLTVVLAVVTTIIHRASWIGAGYSTAAKSPHEQKMAGLLGTWRGALNALFYVLIAIGIIVMMNHKSFATDARTIKIALSEHISQELVAPENRSDFARRIAAVPAQIHNIGQDAPLSQKRNLDTPVLDAAHQAFKSYEGDSEGNARFQEYRTLYHQLMMASAMREMLPPVIMGLFCLLLVLAMISTDDTRIFSASLTFTQDVILPLMKKQPTPKQHMWLLRWASIGVGVFFLCGSFFMSQLDYINLFVTLMCMMWLGGCGPVMIFGLYSRFGNTAGAFASLISGMLLSFSSIFVQRNWADVVYPWLAKHGWVDSVGRFLEAVSSPLNPYVVWKMDPVKFPINSYELYLLTMIITLCIYVVVSAATQRKPFNLDRMLHRGIYNTDGEKKEKTAWSWRTIGAKLIGITTEYTRSDRVIAWSVFLYSFIYKFILAFVLVIIWNGITPWPIEWWGHYFFITTLLIPGIVAFISTFWFGIGGVIDMYRLFRDLEHREVDHLDNGAVEGNVSLADKAKFTEAENQAEAASNGSKQ
ncbi:MAG: sodium:panthothenate symporter [Lentisphaerae bacterium]|nr:sodium:panthothenate symporter [Lentisphaerota bacterium]